MNDNISDLYADYLLSSFGSVTATGQFEHPDGVLIADDSIPEKPPTDENDIICRHYIAHVFRKKRKILYTNHRGKLYHL